MSTSASASASAPWISNRLAADPTQKAYLVTGQGPELRVTLSEVRETYGPLDLPILDPDTRKPYIFSDALRADRTQQAYLVRWNGQNQVVTFAEAQGHAGSGITIRDGNTGQVVDVSPVREVDTTDALSGQMHSVNYLVRKHHEGVKREQVERDNKAAKEAKHGDKFRHMQEEAKKGGKGLEDDDDDGAEWLLEQ